MEVINLINEYGVEGIIIFIILLFLGFKWIVDAIVWTKKTILRWQTKKKKEDKKEESVSDRIKKLEDHDIKQYDRLLNIEDVLDKITHTLNTQQEIVADIKIDAMRREILDFASCCGDKKRRATREQYAYILRTYDQYEAFLQKVGRANGEAELSIKIIQKEYERNLLNNNFVDGAYEVEEEKQSE